MSSMVRQLAPLRVAAAMAGGLLLFTTGQPLRAQEEENLATVMRLERAFVDVIERAEKSVVSISRYRFASPRVDRPELPSDVFVPNEFGSGVLISSEDRRSEPLVLTNYHLVRGGPIVGQSSGMRDADLVVRFSDRRRCRAEIRAADPRSDLAVLELRLEEAGIRPGDLTPFTLQRNPEPFKKGRFVVLLGNPYAQARDGSASAGWGIISNVGRRPQRPAVSETDPDPSAEQTIHHFGTLLQIDARLNLGTSGGALLNLRGELIGLTTSLAALEGYEKSVGYAVPFDKAALRVIDSLRKGYEVEYGFLGVQLDTSQAERIRELSREFNRQTAARVLSVIRYSPADVAGLVDRDLILRVNGVPVYDGYDLMREVGLLGPGAVARLQVWRNGRRLNLNVRLGKWPVRDDEGIIATRRRFAPWRGLSVDYATGRAEYLPYPLDRYPQAVVIMHIEPDSPAARPGADLQVGDFITHVNGLPVRTPAEFHQAVSRLSGVVNLQLASGRRVQLSE